MVAQFRPRRRAPEPQLPLPAASCRCLRAQFRRAPADLGGFFWTTIGLDSTTISPAYRTACCPIVSDGLSVSSVSMLCCAVPCAGAERVSELSSGEPLRPAEYRGEAVSHGVVLFRVRTVRRAERGREVISDGEEPSSPAASRWNQGTNTGTQEGNTGTAWSVGCYVDPSTLYPSGVCS